ncbi:MAG: pilin [Methyloprofundus sp.]|nr:pilin [Methyloprofundus sp.]
MTPCFFSLASGGKTLVAENVASNLAIDPSSCLGFNSAVAGNVKTLTCTSGVIDVVMNSKAGDATLTLTPEYTAGAPISWTCTGTPNNYIPAECRQ